MENYRREDLVNCRINAQDFQNDLEELLQLIHENNTKIVEIAGALELIDKDASRYSNKYLAFTPKDIDDLLQRYDDLNLNKDE